MEREHQVPELIELGTTSSDTHGNPIGKTAEAIGFYPLGLSDD
jgi:hypothetical protein